MLLKVGQFQWRRSGLAASAPRVNLIGASGNITNANWYKTNATAVGTADRDGGNNAAVLQAAASTFTSVISSGAIAPVPTVTGSHVFSVIAKQGTGATDANKLILLNTVTSSIILNFSINFSSGVISGALIPPGTTSTDLGGGWWLIVAPFASLTAGQRINTYLAFSGATETAGENAIWYGPMLEVGTTAPAARVLT